MNAKRMVVRGLVQGVGYRAWMVHQARKLGVDGWVRNRSDGSVEALVAGETASVEELLRMCRRGPKLAEVFISCPLSERSEHLSPRRFQRRVCIRQRSRNAECVQTCNAVLADATGHDTAEMRQIG